MRILIIAAHPDDEVLGCGGTIRLLADEGKDVYIAILGEGITSRFDNRHEADESQFRALNDKSRKVAKFLGAKDLFLKNFPDNRFDTLPLLNIIKSVESILQEVQPDVVYTHSGSDLNIDHVITFRAVLTATRPTPGQSVREVYTFEIPSSTEWTFSQFQPLFKPNVFVGIEKTLEIKKKALEMYTSEVNKFPHPRSVKLIEAIACKWGATVGLQAAEAFQLIRSIR